MQYFLTYNQNTLVRKRHFKVKFLILKNQYFSFIQFCSADVQHQNQLLSQFRGRLFQIYFGSLESLETKNLSVVNIEDLDVFFK